MTGIKERIAQMDKVSAAMAEYNQACYNLNSCITFEKMCSRMPDDRWTWEDFEPEDMSSPRYYVRQILSKYAFANESLLAFKE